MKKISIILNTLFLLLLISCSSDNDNNELINTNHLVKREYVSNNVNLEYRYNTNEHLIRIIDIDNQEDIDSETNFVYDSNNVVTRNFNSNITNISSITNYSFNGNDKLLNAISVINEPNNTINPTVTNIQEFSYNDNIITVNISSSVGDLVTVILEVNSLGLVNKMIKSEYYTTITYDSNENISEIKTFDNNDNLVDTSEYIYDNKPNPFYGQLKSIYLPIFLSSFSNADVGVYGWDGYVGYDFPFLKNNITSISENGNLDRDYTYQYNSENYPINVIEIFNGINAFEYDIEY